MVMAGFQRLGWARFPAEPALIAWAAAALSDARCRVATSSEGWKCGGTWFVGVDALANDPAGRVAGVPLVGRAMRAAQGLYGALPQHRAQISVMKPGYPQPSADEIPAAYGYRLHRDSAHVDGLLPVGPDRRRMLQEPHAYILGLALNQTGAGASPLVVWDGSHKIMAAVFAQAFAGMDPGLWPQTDVTDMYQEARRKVFSQCQRRLLHQAPGEAVLLHRQLLHGVSPWSLGAEAPPEGRMIAYLRPQLPDIADWL
jgi:hypothetical protein